MGKDTLESLVGQIVVDIEYYENDLGQIHQIAIITDDGQTFTISPDGGNYGPLSLEFREQ